MPTVTVAERVNAPVEQVWSHYSWRGVQKLCGNGLLHKAEFPDDTSDPGAKRRMYGAEGLPMLERLEWQVEREHSYCYLVVDDGSLPVTDYRGTVRLTPAGADACLLTISCEFTPVSVTASEWSEQWSAVQRMLIDQLRVSMGQPREHAA